MKYIIDSANPAQIEEALSIGACGITANPSMYKANSISLPAFLHVYTPYHLPFLSGEVMGPGPETLWKEAMILLAIDPTIVIKINFSANGLKLCKKLHELGHRTAMTLIFTMGQAVAAINAGADYLFAFIGRTDEYGCDGIELVTSIQQMVTAKKYPVSVVAASIKNLHQLEIIAKAGLDYAAVPYSLLMQSLSHPLTEKGTEAFWADWRK